MLSLLLANNFISPNYEFVKMSNLNNNRENGEGGEVVKKAFWSEEHENILIEWADKAMCYRWLHAKSNQKYSRLNARFTIPTIIISTITGTANFAQDKFPDQYKEYAPMMIGAFNILAGIMSTVQQFLKVAELNEGHRASAISWDKFYRNIKVELAKNPGERTEVGQMIKICKEEFDRLMETSPVIGDDIVRQFKKAFKNSPGFAKVKKPEICDDMTTTNEFRFMDKLGGLVDDGKKKAIEKLKAERARLIKEYTDRIEGFKRQFIELNSRDPMENEIVDNLRDDVDEVLLLAIINGTASPDDVVANDLADVDMTIAPTEAV